MSPKALLRFIGIVLGVALVLGMVACQSQSSSDQSQSSSDCQTTTTSSACPSPGGDKVDFSNEGDDPNNGVTHEDPVDRPVDDHPVYHPVYHPVK